MSNDDLEALIKKLTRLGIFYLAFLVICAIIGTVAFLELEKYWFAIGFLVFSILVIFLIWNMIRGINASLQSTIEHNRKIAKINKAINEINQSLKGAKNNEQ